MSKTILITGKNSYVGNQVVDWLSKKPEEYKIVKKSVRDNKWKEIDFSIFDIVIHIAGIAHQESKGIADKLYYEINTDLSVSIAKLAKKNNVKQFIFMSSMIVYGTSNPLGEPKVINKNTLPTPANSYGDSKYQADLALQKLADKKFKVVILRSPMIYGPGSTGNFPILAKFAKNTPIFPNIENQRSMIYIDNLSELIFLIIKKNLDGIFLPQNKEFVKTSAMVQEIARQSNRNLKLVNWFNPLLKLIKGRLNLINKVFGNLTYEKQSSDLELNYNLVDFEKSIYLTLNKYKEFK